MAKRSENVVVLPHRRIYKVEIKKLWLLNGYPCKSKFSDLHLNRKDSIRTSQ